MNPHPTADERALGAAFMPLDTLRGIVAFLMAERNRLTDRIRGRALALRGVNRLLADVFHDGVAWTADDIGLHERAGEGDLYDALEERLEQVGVLRRGDLVVLRDGWARIHHDEVVRHGQVSELVVALAEALSSRERFLRRATTGQLRRWRLDLGPVLEDCERRDLDGEIGRRAARVDRASAGARLQAAR